MAQEIEEGIAKKRGPKFKYASIDDVEELKQSVYKLIEIVQQKTATPEEAKKNKEVEKAAPNRFMQMNPEWEEKAREILGDAVERLELEMPRGGGSRFTVVVKKSHSNASAEYLKMFGEDRRTKEIGNEGIEGVEQWCKLIKNNLKRNE